MAIMTAKGWMAVAAACAIGVLATSGEAAPRRSAERPVVVELFTAQGCGGCPEANAAVEEAAETPGVIALTYGVDYWDYLGWRDTFAKPAFGARQRAYRSAMRLRGVSTPQVVIGGRSQVSGAREPELQGAIQREAARETWPPEIEFRETGRQVGVGSGRAPTGGAEVVAITYRPGPQVVEVARGDNRGEVVRHMNVVREITRLGDWRGRPVLFDLPVVAAGEETVVMVQGKADRRILGAAVSN